MATILLTGGLGFIGSHTAVELIALGHEVIIVDNLSNSRIEVLEGIEKISGVKPVFENKDVSNKLDIEQLCSKYKFDGCIHFAAYKAVGESVNKPLEYYQNNIASLVYLLQVFRDKGFSNFIFSSSCTVYGQADEMPITEDAPVKPAESPYGNTKQIGEEIIQEAIKAHSDLNAISLRYFNPIGAHESSEIGELPLGVPLNLVPYITQTAAGIRKELKVFGNDYPTPDGTAIRDYIHVVDLAKAHVKALDRLMKHENNDPYEVFNLGTGKGSSVLEAINSFEKVSGEKLNWTFAPRRAGDVIEAYADTTKANEVLGWKAEKNIEDCMRDAWRWQQKLGK
ncbi:MAG: UDP-glucose 4-epimerase GalE [Schleiferiaceae bacterium]|nr:UDP-glucose 4-epimerase GalE [Schleiferiaceae bacterium]